jgi:hypothetical protein
MSAIEIVKDEAKKLGKTIDDRTADFILWGETGWPAFWDIPRDGKTPEECLRTQVRRSFTEPDAEC